MCLATPVLILNTQGAEAEVEIGGLRRMVSIALTPEANPGDYVLVHAGYAIGTINENDAKETLLLLKEMEDMSDEEGDTP
ncbi:MAG: HypC/HybG/HupF family hydrogenase formation chaperone [Syntrophorhabdaceae bacterium]